MRTMPSSTTKSKQSASHHPLPIPPALTLLDSASPLQVSGHPAYGAIYRFSDNSVRPLHVNTNSFCAGGTFLANGTMLSIGGNAVQLQSTYNDSDGRQSIRFYDPCPTVETCDVYDNPAVRYLKAGRWYPTTMRFFDGSALIIGGMADQGYSCVLSRLSPRAY